jgi:uroporphyrinogen-III synthase
MLKVERLHFANWIPLIYHKDLEIKVTTVTASSASFLTFTSKRTPIFFQNIWQKRRPAFGHLWLESLSLITLTSIFSQTCFSESTLFVFPYVCRNIHVPFVLWRIGRKFLLISFHGIAGVSLILATVCTTFASSASFLTFTSKRTPIFFQNIWQKRRPAFGHLW